MATRLDKDIIRESTVQIDGREINITLSDKQEIRMKLKGMKSGEVSIDIEKLYKQLTGKLDEPEGDDNNDIEVSTSKGMTIITRDEEPSSKGKVMIDLDELRSMNAISGFDVPTMARFDGIISDLLKQKKEIVESQKLLSKNSPTKKRK